MKERCVEVGPDAGEKQEKQFETRLWGEGIAVEMMSLGERERLTGDQSRPLQAGTS